MPERLLRRQPITWKHRPSGCNKNNCLPCATLQHHARHDTVCVLSVNKVFNRRCFEITTRRLHKSGLGEASTNHPRLPTIEEEGTAVARREIMSRTAHEAEKKRWLVMS